jgi:hypothetical protein
MTANKADNPTVDKPIKAIVDLENFDPYIARIKKPHKGNAGNSQRRFKIVSIIRFNLF